MHNVSSVKIENFKGLNGTFDFDLLTIISGNNESGKTTITDAVMFALLGYVPGDIVNNTYPDQFEAYCTHEKGLMSIEVTGDSGVFKVEYTKPKKTVSRKATFNGVDLPSKAAGEDYMNVKIFDAKKYWSKLKPSEQVTNLFKYVDVDPAELDRLNQKIEEANDKKKTLTNKKREEEQAHADHNKELQGINDSSEGFNPETAEAELKDLYEKIDRLSKKHREINNSRAEAGTLTAELESLKRANMDYGEELSSIEIPKSDAMDKAEEEELVALENAKDHIYRVEKAEDRAKALEMKVAPTPCAYKESDIEALRNEIVALQDSGGGPTERDRIGYEIAKSIFDAIKAIPVLHKEERVQCLHGIKDATSSFKEAMNGPMLDQDKITQKQSLLSTMRETRQNYDRQYTSYIMSKEEAEDIRKELSMTAQPHFSQERYDQLLRKKSMVGADSARIQALKDRSEWLTSQMNKNFELIEAKNDRLSHLPEMEDALELSKEIENLQGLVPFLRDGIKAQAKYDTVKEMALKKAESIDRIAHDITKWKNIEAEASSEKRQLLARVQDALADKADRMLAPSRMTFELPKTNKSTDRIRFKYHQPSGTVVDRATVSGAQKIEFDLALSYALVGPEGFIVSDEVRNLDPVRLDALVNRLSEFNEAKSIPQTVIVGHSLEQYESKTKAFIQMTKVAS